MINLCGKWRREPPPKGLLKRFSSQVIWEILDELAPAKVIMAFFQLFFAACRRSGWIDSGFVFRVCLAGYEKLNVEAQWRLSGLESSARSQRRHPGSESKQIEIEIGE